MLERTSLSLKEKRIILETEKRPIWAAFVKEARRKENLSGKAMQDEVLTHAKTHGLKSKSLEEG
jgi:hypothetical protein